MINSNLKNINSSFFWDDHISQDSLSASDSVISKRIRSAVDWSESHSGKLINIGSGQGFFERIVDKSLFEEFISLDISYLGLKNIQKQNTIGSQVAADIFDIPFQDGVFDVVIVMEVLEHLRKSESKFAYKELSRIGNQNCTYIFSVPVYEPRSIVNHPVGHYRKYVPKSFMREIIVSGFEVEESELIFSFSNLYKLRKFLTTSMLFSRRPSILILKCKKLSS